jgi:hypothetical protein
VVSELKDNAATFANSQSLPYCTWDFNGTGNVKVGVSFFFRGLALRRWHLRTMLMMIDVESERNDLAVVPLPLGYKQHCAGKAETDLVESCSNMMIPNNLVNIAGHARRRHSSGMDGTICFGLL